MCFDFQILIIAKVKDNSHDIDDEFDQLIAYILTFILESEYVSGMRYRMISFGSHDELINGDNML